MNGSLIDTMSIGQCVKEVLIDIYMLDFSVMLWLSLLLLQS